LVTGEDMKARKPGKSVKSIAFVGDKLWKYGED
jgi:predicted ribosome-associated RNA-binding protein Tma20